jgi:acyl-CoA reductase-like NAD-dependent aldehyde dehydrogenase
VDLAPGKTVDSINEATAEVLANVAAGDAEDINLCGYKMSGYGRESGLQQFDEYLNVKAVWIKTG